MTFATSSVIEVVTEQYQTHFHIHLVISIPILQARFLKL